MSFLGLLLVFLLFFIGGVAVPEEFVHFASNLFFSFFIFASIFTVKGGPKMMAIGFLTAAFAISLNSASLLGSSDYIDLAFLLTMLLFLGVITYKVFSDVFFQSQFHRDAIFGAICVYIFLAAFWAIFYSLIYYFNPDAFLTSHEGVIKLHHLLYFSIVTQTTLGYGDIIPVIPLAKNLAAIQAIMGVFYLATLVASVVDMFQRQRNHSALS